jgi:uncharacterized membrane protein YbaN (DUF454 family)
VGRAICERLDARLAPRLQTGVRRWLLLTFAGLCISLAFVGVWVPGLPTTVFVLMAAWAAMRSSPRLHGWLESHPVFGPVLRNWRLHRAVSRRAKWTATFAMAICSVLCFATAPQRWMAWLGSGTMLAVATWLWLRPEPPLETDSSKAETAEP